MNNNEEYTINDCILVRTTDVFPFDGIVQTAEDGCRLIKSLPEGFEYALRNLLKDNKNINMILESLQIVQKTRRNTTHYCINGLVGSHATGNFQGRPFILFDPFKYHCDSKNLIGIRGEDTFFLGNLVLSSEAAILIKKEVYEIIKNDPLYMDTLSKLKVFIYDQKKESEEEAVKRVLNELGYDSFLIKGHGYDGIGGGNPKADKMDLFLSKFAQEHGISQEPHVSSDNYFERDDLETEDSIEISLKIINEMCKHLNKDEEDTKYYKSIITNRVGSIGYYKEDMENIIKEYGIDNLISLISRINMETINQIYEEKHAKKL